jgi:serine/threonine protein kinase
MEAVISDFGFARELSVSNESAQTMATVGPLRWMYVLLTILFFSFFCNVNIYRAPESLSTRSYSKKSDIWSFGVTIYEILTYGDVPYSNIQEPFMAAAVMKHIDVVVYCYITFFCFFKGGCTWCYTFRSTSKRYSRVIEQCILF